MHEQGYTFNGSANLSDLLPVEIKALQLGHIVKQEQKQEQRRQQQSPHKTTSSDYQQRKRELVNKYRKN